MAKVLLIPGFVETAFYALHYQYLTLKPNFVTHFVGVSTEPTNGLPINDTNVDTMAITRDQYCETPSSGQIINSSSGTETWYGTKHIVCDPDYEVISSNMGLMLICSIVFCTIMIVPMADYHGRKVMSMVLALILIFSLSLISLSQLIMPIQNLKLMAFLICISAGTSAARALISLIFTSELTLSANRGSIIFFCFFFVAVKLLISALHMEFAHTSYMIAVYVNIMINLLTLPILAWYLPESPHYLYSRGKMQDFYASLLKLYDLSYWGCQAPENQLDIVALAQLEPENKKAGNDTEAVLTATRGKHDNNDEEIPQEQESLITQQPKNDHQTPQATESSAQAMVRGAEFKEVQLTDTEAQPSNRDDSLNQSFWQATLNLLRSEASLAKNFIIFVIVTVNSLFCVILCQAYLKPNAHYAIGTVDALACLAFYFMDKKLQTRTNLLIAFAMQAIVAFTLAMILVGLTAEAKQRFEGGLTGFSLQEEYAAESKIGTKEASLYTLVLVVRFSGMLSLTNSCQFGLSRMAQNYSAKRMATFFSFTFSLAFISCMLAEVLVQTLLTNAIGFISATAVLALIAISRFEESADSQLTATKN